MSADAKMPVSVVIERRKSDQPWQDHTWRPIGILPRAAPERWKMLTEGDGWTHFQAGTLTLELFRGETEGYLVNLTQVPPVVYVVLRRGEEADENEVEPFHVTVCPYEAMGYVEGGDDVVEGVSMPPEVRAWVGEFVERYHVETPFIKRKNRRVGDGESASGPRGRERGRPS
jgi:hypothetical protein